MDIIIEDLTPDVFFSANWVNWEDALLDSFLTEHGDNLTPEQLEEVLDMYFYIKESEVAQMYTDKE